MENSEQKTAEVIVTPTENAKEVSPGVFETTGEVHITDPSQHTGETVVLTLAGVKTTVDFSKLTEAELETMSDDQIAEAKAEFEKVKSTVEQTYSELTDVEKVFKARAKAKMKSVLSTAWGYVKTALIIYAAVVATIAVVKLF